MVHYIKILWCYNSVLLLVIYMAHMQQMNCAQYSWVQYNDGLAVQAQSVYVYSGSLWRVVVNCLCVEDLEWEELDIQRIFFWVQVWYVNPAVALLHPVGFVRDSPSPQCFLLWKTFQLWLRGPCLAFANPLPRQGFKWETLDLSSGLFQLFILGNWNFLVAMVCRGWEEL